MLGRDTPMFELQSVKVTAVTHPRCGVVLLNNAPLVNALLMAVTARDLRAVANSNTAAFGSRLSLIKLLLLLGVATCVAPRCHPFLQLRRARFRNVTRKSNTLTNV